MKYLCYRGVWFIILICKRLNSPIKLDIVIGKADPWMALGKIITFLYINHSLKGYSSLTPWTESGRCKLDEPFYRHFHLYGGFFSNSKHSPYINSINPLQIHINQSTYITVRLERKGKPLKLVTSHIQGAFPVRFEFPFSFARKSLGCLSILVATHRVLLYDTLTKVTEQTKAHFLTSPAPLDWTELWREHVKWSCEMGAHSTRGCSTCPAPHVRRLG